MNQIGTLTETFDAIEMAQKLVTQQLFHTVQVKLKILQLLTLQLLQTLDKLKLVHYQELIVFKYNQLLRIEDELYETAKFDGIKSFYNLDK